MLDASLKKSEFHNRHSDQSTTLMLIISRYRRHYHSVSQQHFCRCSILIAHHRFDRGDISFIIIAGAMVFFMIPGIGSQFSLTSHFPSAHLHCYISLSIFRIVKTKVRFVSYLGSLCQQCSLYFSVVLLGLLLGVFANCHQRIHRQPCQLWSHKCSWRPVTRFPINS